MNQVSALTIEGEKVRIAVVGFGNFGRVWARCWHLTTTTPFTW